MNYIKQNLSTFAVVLVAVVLGQMLVGTSASILGAAGVGPTHWQTENFLQGLYAGTSGQFHVTNAGVVTAGALTAAATSLSGALNASSTANFQGAVSLRSETTLANCGTASVTIPALGPAVSATSSFSTNVSVAGATYGDVLLTSISSVTSTPAAAFIFTRADVTTTDGTSTVMFRNQTSTATTAITTTTLKVCYFD